METQEVGLVEAEGRGVLPEGLCLVLCTFLSAFSLSLCFLVIKRWETFLHTTPSCRGVAASPPAWNQRSRSATDWNLWNHETNRSSLLQVVYAGYFISYEKLTHSSSWKVLKDRSVFFGDMILTEYKSTSRPASLQDSGIWVTCQLGQLWDPTWSFMDHTSEYVWVVMEVWAWDPCLASCPFLWAFFPRSALGPQKLST